MTPEQSRLRRLFPVSGSSDTDIVASVPSKGTPGRTIRVPDTVWLPFADACKARGLTPSEVIRDCIRKFLVSHDDELLARAMEVAAERGEDLDAVVSDLLTKYVAASPDPADESN